VHATLLGALGEPSRLRIVETLRDGPSSVGDLVERLELRQPQVSKHLRVLSEAGVVVGEPHARQRIYRLRSEPFEQIASWVDSFERLWEVRLDALGRYLDATGPTDTADLKENEHG
jgi:DNA-binding transcriptional ArsR family regulator